MNLDGAVFYTSDIEKITDFYQNIIGLQLEYRQGDKFVSFIFPNGGRLGIKKAVEQRETPGKQSVFIAVDQIEELYQQLKDQDLNIYKELTDESWGTAFDILDPDDNKVVFMRRKK